MKSQWGEEQQEQQKLSVLVIDSGAIIKGHGGNFHTVADRLVTVEEVVAEIRDSKSREILLKLPFELEIHNPSDDAMAAVARFAEKSGDFAALSLTDLKVMALAYTFEVGLCDKSHIRKDPVDNRTLQWRQRQQRNGASVAMLNVKKAAPANSSAQREDTLDEADTNDNNDEFSQENTEQMEEGLGIDDKPQDEEQIEQIEEGDEGVEEDYEEEYEDGYGDYYDDEEEGEYREYDEDEEEEGEEEEEERAKSPFSFENAKEDFPSLGPTEEANDQAGSIGWGPGCYVQPKKNDATTEANTVPPMQPPGNAGVSGSKLERGKPFDAAAYLQPYLQRQVKDTAGRGTVGDGNTSAVIPVAAAAAVISKEVNRDDDLSATSRILSGGTGSSGTTTMSQVRAAFEDDGVGWINTSNIKQCVATGTGMIGSKLLQVSSEDGAGADDGFTLASNKNKNKNKAKDKTKDKTQGQQPQQQQQQQQQKKKGNEVPRKVGCVTTDFTMQNVLIQMNLHVVNVDGMQIRTVKQWVLRCMACFTIHYDMDRLFCSKCGANHMSRVACSIDFKTGNLRLHLKKGYTPNRRGKQHSLPLPGKQGRFQGELLLREDQLLTGIWRQKTVKMQKDVRSAFGHDITSDVGLHINKGQAIRVGLGRANPNADKGRERRGAKKKKNKK